MKLYKKAFKILEFSKIIDMLENVVVCEENKLKIRKIVPYSSLHDAENKCFETDEALVILTRFSDPGFFNVKNVTDSFHKAKYGVHLNCAMLLNVGKILK